MIKIRVFVAFDYDDKSVKEDLIAQSRLPECPYDVVDGSIQKLVATDWPAEARRLIAGCECVIILCGEQTHQAQGVAVELQIAQALRKPHFFLAATRSGVPTPPCHAPRGTRIWTFTWSTVRDLLDGREPPTSAVRRQV